jgi:hypothetical protein
MAPPYWVSSISSQSCMRWEAIAIALTLHMRKSTRKAKRQGVIEIVKEVLLLLSPVPMPGKGGSRDSERNRWVESVGIREGTNSTMSLVAGSPAPLMLPAYHLLFSLPRSHLARTNDEWGKPARISGALSRAAANRRREIGFNTIARTLIWSLFMSTLSIDKWRNRDRQSFIEKEM